MRTRALAIDLQPLRWLVLTFPALPVMSLLTLFLLGGCATTRIAVPPSQDVASQEKVLHFTVVESGCETCSTAVVTFTSGMVTFRFTDGSTESFLEKGCPQEMRLLFKKKGCLNNKEVFLTRTLLIPDNGSATIALYILRGEGFEMAFTPPEPLYEQ